MDVHSEKMDVRWVGFHPLSSNESLQRAAQNRKTKSTLKVAANILL
jgi:hypothetical protein